MGQVLFVNARPGVRDSNIDSGILLNRPDFNLQHASRRHHFQGIQKKIEKHLFYFVGVNHNLRAVGQIRLDGDFLRLSLAGDHLQRLADQRQDGGRLLFQGDRPGKIKQLRDDPVQPFHLLHHDIGGFSIHRIIAVPFLEIGGKALNRTEGVPYFMGHAGGQVAQRGEPLAAGDFLFQVPDLRQIKKKDDRPQEGAVLFKKRGGNHFQGNGFPFRQEAVNLLFDNSFFLRQRDDNFLKGPGQDIMISGADYFPGLEVQNGFSGLIKGYNHPPVVERYQTDRHMFHQAVGKDLDAGQGAAGGAVALGEKERNHAGQTDEKQQGRHQNGVARGIFPGCFNRSHIQTDENNQPRDQAISSGLNFSLRRGVVMSSGRRKPAKNFEGIHSIGIRPQPPGDPGSLGKALEIQLPAIIFPDQVGITVGDNFSPGIGDGNEINIRLLRRFHEELLELEKIRLPLHPPAADTRFKGPDQGFAFFDEDLDGVFPLFADIIYGHENKDGCQNEHRPNDQPGRNAHPGYRAGIFILGIHILFCLP